MEKREIVEVLLLKSLKTRKGEILKPGKYLDPVPSDLLQEISLNRGMVVVRYKKPEIAMPQEQLPVEEINTEAIDTKEPEIEVLQETKPALVRRRKK